MAKTAPGKAHREGITIVELMEMFPTEEAATEWFESAIWPDGERYCGKCGSVRTREVPNAKPMPYWCRDCRSYFSVRTGTPIARTNVPLRKWAIAIYLCLTSLKSISSMKLQRDIGVSQPTAWFMLHRIREAWAEGDDENFDGPVEVDETYMGGERKNKPNAERRAVREASLGRGPVDKMAVVGATVYTDEAAAYKGLAREFGHEAVNHAVPEYVRGQAHTNGMDSLWPMLKRAHDGTFHEIGSKHLRRYVFKFAGKHNLRDSGTLVQMRDTVARLVGRNFLYRDLTADNGLPAGAWS